MQTMSSFPIETPPADKRIGALFDTLLTLSQSLVAPADRDDAGGLHAMFDAVLTAIGCARGAAYTVVDGSLSLLAERGLPAKLWLALDGLSLSAPPVFIAQQAATKKGLVVDRAAASFDTELARALVLAGWSSAVACPIVAEGQVYGVIVLAMPAGELSAPALATLQVGCNLVAHRLVRQGLERRLHDQQGADARPARQTPEAEAPTPRPPSGRVRIDPGSPRRHGSSGAHRAADDPRMAPTYPMFPVPDSEPARARSDSERTHTLRSSGAAVVPFAPHAQPGTSRARPRSTPPPEADAAPAMREAQLHAQAVSIADALRKSGPARGPAVLEMLRQRGLSEPEALAVVMHGLATDTIVRGTPGSGLLEAAPLKLQKTVLVVDDDDDVRESLRQVLEEDGYLVDTAANGQQALDKLRRSDAACQLVLLDLNMPVMDGWTFLQEARSDPALAQIPVLVLSAWNVKNVGEESLAKPVNYYALIATVERLAKRAASSA